MVHSFLIKTAALVSSTLLASVLLASLGAADEDQGIVTLKHPGGSSAKISLLGAQVTSFRSTHDPDLELLFVSNESRLGGMTVAFPAIDPDQGANPVPEYGFARTSKWSLVSVNQSTDVTLSSTAIFSLEDSDTTRQMWPNKFKLTLTVQLWGAWLETTLNVHNTDSTSISFNALLQTYLAITAVPDNYVSISGLTGVEYYDRLKATTQIDSRFSFLIPSRVDSVYKNVKDDVAAYFKNLNQHVYVEASSGFGDEGHELRRTETDRVISNAPLGFGYDEHLPMVAIGSGKVMEQQELSSGRYYSLHQTIKVARYSVH